MMKQFSGGKMARMMGQMAAKGLGKGLGKGGLFK